MKNQQLPKICPICKEGKDFKFIKDFEKEGTKYSLYQCFDCKVQFWLPQATPGLDWYESKNFRIRNIIKPGINRGYHKKFLEIHKTFPQGAIILDLGCGAGELIAELKKRGCEVWGVDLDRESTRVAKEHFGLEKVFAQSFDDFFQRADLPKFDMITFFEAIAYLTDPLEFIGNFTKLLKPGGKVVLSVPSRERMLSNLNHWDFPPHYFTRWNSQAISYIFKKHKFSISRLDYVEQLKILSQSVSGKFKTGLVGKSLAVSEKKKKSLILPKIIYFLGCFKDYFIGTVPASFLWAFGKIIGRNNGIMLIELKNENGE